MVLVQNWPIFQLFFLAIYASKMSFTIFQNEKTPFQAIKTRSSKSRKIDNFSKGVNKWLLFNNGFLSNFLLANIGQQKVFYHILERKTPLQAIKRRSSKSRKIDILPKGLTHGFGPNMAIFSTFFFLGNIGQENVFYDILERKNAFLGYKNKKFKKWKN